MANPKLGRNGNGNVRVETEQRSALGDNSICPLPLIGWKPKFNVLSDGVAEPPPMVKCMGTICGFFVKLTEDGRGQCGVAAISSVLSSLPQIAMNLSQQSEQHTNLAEAASTLMFEGQPTDKKCDRCLKPMPPGSMLFDGGIRCDSCRVAERIPPETNGARTAVE